MREKTGLLNFCALLWSHNDDRNVSYGKLTNDSALTSNTSGISGLVNLELLQSGRVGVA